MIFKVDYGEVSGGWSPTLVYSTSYDTGDTTKTYTLTSGKTYLYVYDQENVNSYDLTFSGATEIMHQRSNGYLFGSGHTVIVTVVLFKATSSSVTISTTMGNNRANGMIFQLD